MYRQLDFSVRPCHHFYSHVCNSFGEGPDIPNIKVFEYYSESDFYTKPATPAGLAMHSLFQSCLIHTQNAHKLGGSTAATYIDALGANNVVRVKTPPELLAFLFGMTVKYDIRISPAIAVYGRGGFPDYLYFSGMDKIGEFLVIALKKTRPRVESVLIDKYNHLRQECLKSINQLLSINVTLETMEDIEREIDLNYTATYAMSNSSVVAHLVPSLTLDDWGAVVRNVSGVDLPAKLYHTDLAVTQQILAATLDVDGQPTTSAFFIFKAVSDLLLDHMKYGNRHSSTSAFRYCRRVVSRHSALSAVAVLEENQRGREHDDTFRRIFAEIVDAISAEAATILPSHDQRNVSTYLKSLKILLPTEVYPERNVPPMSSDYVRNLITLFTSGWAYYSYKRPPGITRLVSQAAVTNGIVVINRTVVIPLVTYSVLSFNSSTDHVVTMSAIGVLIADAIWSDMLLKRVWSAETTKMVTNYTSCLKNLRVFFPDRFFLFKLTIMSINTALRVTRGSQWLEEFSVSSRWATSRCRLFYYLFVHHHYCPVNKISRKQLAEEVQYIASISNDFLSAFQCPRPTTGDVPTCSMSSQL
ncbi:hypothetical protein HPB52_020678 [Rhipicephalus sanguineus]|uniref:Uncharacterized protein n=1 Tax=Rhipicephalus sanguineus TaxID=34632 RepID=A0A9D4Q2M6_RHISA|nr:hypothetical protein HPB52_020678 [Rhipicephalus sanguineus]